MTGVIWVAYAAIDEQVELTVSAHAGMTVRDAIEQSGLLSHFPKIDLLQQSVGIDSKKVSLDTPVVSGQRVEVYRVLTLDPNTARLRRAEAKRARLSDRDQS